MLIVLKVVWLPEQKHGISEGVKRIVADLISNSAKSIKSSGNKAKTNVQSAVATTNKETNKTTNKTINKGRKETTKLSKKASKDNYKDFIKETNNIIKSYNRSKDKLGLVTVDPKVNKDLEVYMKKKK